MKKKGPRFLMPEKAKTLSPNRQTIEKALIWLREERRELAGHITDVNLVAQLYLKDQERKKESASSLKERPPFVPGLRKESASSLKEWPPYISNLHESKQADRRHLQTGHFQSKASFLLDEKSRQAVEKAQSQLNIPAEAALKVLIQLGCRTLQTLFK